MFTSDSVGILLSFFGTAFFDESNITSFLQYALALQYVEPSAVLMEGFGEPSAVLMMEGFNEPSAVLMEGFNEPSAVLMEGFNEPSAVLMEGFNEPSAVLMEGVLRCGVFVEEEGRP
jgi:hypothetical protein